MQIAVRTSETIFVIDKSKKPWEMNGRNGISYHAICHKKVGDETQVEKIRVTEDVYNQIEAMTKYDFEGIIDVKNGRLTFDKIVYRDVNRTSSAGTSGSAVIPPESGKKTK